MHRFGKRRVCSRGGALTSVNRFTADCDCFSRTNEAEIAGSGPTIVRGVHRSEFVTLGESVRVLRQQFGGNSCRLIEAERAR